MLICEYPDQLDRDAHHVYRTHIISSTDAIHVSFSADIGQALGRFLVAQVRAIAATKGKNDGIDASKICDCLRCDFLPGALYGFQLTFPRADEKCISAIK
jgi:hypothetical protein